MSVSASNYVWHQAPASLDPTAVLVLLCLADEADDQGLKCFPSIRRIAEKARISVSGVRKVLERLEANGELIVYRPPKQGRGHFNRYALVMGRDPNEVAEWLASEQISSAPKVDSSPPFTSNRAEKGYTKGTQKGTLERANPYPDPKENDILKNADAFSACSPDGEPRLSAAERRGVEFEQWYNDWPRKIDKAKALKWWQKHKPDETLREALDAAQSSYLESRAEYERLYGQLPADVVYPTTWLNGVWQDFADGPTLERWPKPKVDAKQVAADDLRAKLKAAMGETPQAPERAEVIDI